MEKSEYIGLIPAAGRATRLKHLPCSKEIYPLGECANNGDGQAILACDCLIQAYVRAGIDRAYIIIREGKEDICQRLGNGQRYGIELAYLYTDLPYGPPYTLNQAYRFVRDQYIAFGFPDIQFRPRHAFIDLIEKQRQTMADVVLALFPAYDPKKLDMVGLDQDQKIKLIDIKPIRTTLTWTWVLAVWSPVFSEFMRRYLTEHLDEYRAGRLTEPHVGTVFQAALAADVKFESVIFEHGNLIDIGTPDDLRRIKQMILNDEWISG